MKKIYVIFVIGMFFLSGLGVMASTGTTNKISKTISISEPTISSNDKYSIINIDAYYNSLKVPGKPEIPFVPYSVDLPFGTRNIDVKITTSEEKEIKLFHKIKPSPEVVVNKPNAELKKTSEDISIYGSTKMYPSSSHNYKITIGMKPNKQRVTHISFYLYPVRYSPANNIIKYVDQIDIEISYDVPKYPFDFRDEYDMLIIAPEEFSSEIQPLINHKNENNVQTYLKTTEEIFDEYTGLDKPEQIKKYIQYSIENFNIQYVLLIGGLKKYYKAVDREDCNQGSEDWYVPVRYTNIKKSGLSDPGALSDLYYADVYKYDGGPVFEDWDSSADGIIAHWGKFSGTPVDELDFNIDVYVSRLPCRSKYELKTVINKIINYESSSPSSKSWFIKMIGITGQNHAMYGGQPDGEYIVDTAFGYMDDIIDNEVKIYASNEDSGGLIPVSRDIRKEFNKGAGFVYFSGHGNPLRWDTHPVDTLEEWMGGTHNRKMWFFLNMRKLPIVVVGGCHNAQFNVTWYTTRHSLDLGEDHWYWTHGDPGPVCFNWRMITIPWGGAIANVGGTGLTTSWVGIPISLNTEMAVNIFYMIGQEEAQTFGEAYSSAMQKFLDDNDMQLTESHAFTIFNSFGDPSLKLGGFE